MKQHSKNSLFLMEIIINIMIFMLLIVTQLQFFIRTRSLTTDTGRLYQAVTSCSNAAAIFESGDGTWNSLLENYGYSVNLGSQLIIYLDSSFEPCQKEQSLYYLAITPKDGTASLSKSRITCCDQKDVPIYALTVCHYSQRQHVAVGEVNR